MAGLEVRIAVAEEAADTARVAVHHTVLVVGELHTGLEVAVLRTVLGEAARHTVPEAAHHIGLVEVHRTDPAEEAVDPTVAAAGADLHDVPGEVGRRTG